MPFRKVKKDTSEKLTLQWLLQAEDYKLDLDKNFVQVVRSAALLVQRKPLNLKNHPRLKGKRPRRLKLTLT